MDEVERWRRSLVISLLKSVVGAQADELEEGLVGESVCRPG